MTDPAAPHPTSNGTGTGTVIIPSNELLIGISHRIYVGKEGVGLGVEAEGVRSYHGLLSNYVLTIFSEVTQPWWDPAMSTCRDHRN